MTDVERFFVQLVRNLAGGDRSRLRQPLAVAEIRNSILPYRASRRALQLESSEDYELVLMRLCAGEGGFARTEPVEARVEFEMEVGSPNPDLTLVERHDKAVLNLDPDAVTKALDRKPELAYAPREPGSQAANVEEPFVSSSGGPSIRRGNTASARQPEDGPPRCSRCGADLPIDRVVNFCPQCGQNLKRHCPECGTEIERDWRHCITCGAAVHDI